MRQIIFNPNITNFKKLEELKKLRVPELKKIARNLLMNNYSKLKKEDLIFHIDKFQKEIIEMKKEDINMLILNDYFCANKKTHTNIYYEDGRHWNRGGGLNR